MVTPLSSGPVFRLTGHDSQGNYWDAVIGWTELAALLAKLSIGESLPAIRRIG
jgi:hypothetical protein